MKRLLTEKEIEDSISCINVIRKESHPIPVKSLISIIENLKNNLRVQLKTQEIYPELIPKLKLKIEKMYQSSLIQAGECVGVIAGQSIGERQTQTNLNHFHKAGTGDFEVNVVSEFSELINATVKIKTAGGLVYFKDYDSSVSSLRNSIGDLLVEISIKKLVKHYKTFINKERENWYDLYENIYDTEIKYPHCLRLYIDSNVLYTYKLPLYKIAEKINEIIDIQAICSPDSLSIIDVFADISEVDLDEKYNLSDNEKILLYMEQVVYKNLSNIIVAGISGIKNMYFIKHENTGKWGLELEGMNYTKLMALDIVNTVKTVSNNIWDIYYVLGIEALREFMIKKFLRIVSGINPCHIMLIVDKMLFNGTIASINRYSLKKDTTGPLIKATFEETFDMLVQAGVYGEVDDTRGVSASIICGKPARIGTGLIDILYDTNKLIQTEEKEICVPLEKEIVVNDLQEIKIGDLIPITITKTQYKNRKYICFGELAKEKLKKTKLIKTKLKKKNELKIPSK